MELDVRGDDDLVPIRDVDPVIGSSAVVAHHETRSGGGAQFGGG